MKNTLKRIIAMVLLLGTLASFVVPATYADSETVGEVVQKFDFELYNYDLFKDVIPGNANKWSKAEVRKAIQDAYPAQNNWVIETYGSDVDYNKLVFYKAQGGFRATDVAGKWVAFRLNVEQDGNYGIILNSTYASAAFTAKTWLFPASEETMQPADVEAKMTAGNAQYDVTIGSDAKMAPVGAASLSAGEYILVLQSQAEKMHISNLKLVRISADDVPDSTTETTVELPDILFDLELYNYDKFSSVIDGGFNKWSKAVVRNAVLNAYPADNNWIIEKYSDGVDYNKLQFIKNYTSFKMVIPANEWVAFRLNVDTAGNYQMVLTNLYKNAPEYAAKTWLIPVAAGVTKDTVADYMTSQYAGNDVNIEKAGEAEIFEGEFAIGEYILVVGTEKDADVYISNLRLVPITEEEEPTVESTTTGSTEGTTESTTEPSTEAPTVPSATMKENVFDFELYNYGTFADVIDGKNNKWTKATVRNAVKEAFPTTNNWTIEAYAEGVDTDNLQFISSQYGLRMTGVKDKWVAFRLNVANGGKLELWLNSLHAYSYSAKAWVFPAPEQTLTAAEVEAYMTDDNAAEDLKFGSKGGRALVCEKEFAAGQYILVMKAMGDRMYLSNLELAERAVEVPKEPVDKMVYDFDLLTMDENFKDKGFTNWYDPDTKKVIVYEKVAQMYEEDVIQWKYETISSGAKKFTIKPGNLRIKSGSNFVELGETWNALRIEAPGAGTYDIRLTSADTSTTVADIYLIPARTGFAMKAEDIEANMTAENLLVSGALLSGKDTFYLGEYTFGPEYEYILVFKCTRGKVLYMNNMQVTKDGLVADTQVRKLPTYNGVVYNFDIGDQYTGILQPLGEYRYDMPTPKEAGYKSPYEQINAFYKNGTLNWKWIMGSEDLVDLGENEEILPNDYNRFYQDTGMYIYSKKNSWVAFQIKSPGEGDFTLTMNHAVSPNDGTVAVYILPADTPKDQIWQATDPSNRVGKVVLTKPDGSAGKKDGYESFIGYWNFEAGKEYILVLEAYENSKFKSTEGNMNITNIVMQKGIHEYETADEKVVSPVTVAERVHAVADSGQGNVAFFEMNGMDYYLVWLEGGTIYLYNLDTGEVEDEQYSYTIRPRHMAVAPVGKVWLSYGKALVCYDPYEKVLTKTKTWLPGEYKHNGSRYVTVTPEGILYIALYGSGHVIEYNPETKKFRDLGYFMDPLANINSLLYEDGYLYIPCHISDKFNVILKYNIATGQVEKTLDVIEHTTGTSTAMSYLGEDIIVCGVQTTDKDHAVAFNKHTMEFVDIGVPAGVSNLVTEEINGKQYMIVHNNGLYEYDVATKEINKVTGFTSMSAGGFRGGAHCSYGKSWATINGDLCLLANDSQGSVAPRVINLDKKEYYVWTDLTRNAKGGGSDLISFTEGEPGSGDLVMGLYNALYIATYNIYTGEIKTNDSAGQTDSIGYYKGILYGGCYSATVLVELHRDTNEIIQRFKLDHDLTGQKRLLSMEFGDDRVFVGTVPKTYENGGALAVYNTLTGQWYYERNIVPDQSIVDEAYSQKTIFLASSRAGGDNAPDAGDSALIVAYDYENREILGTLDPRDYIPELPSPVYYIYGLTADPHTEENGRVWAVVSDTLFCFTFDRETRKFDVQIVKSLGKSSYYNASGTPRQQNKIQFLEDRSQLYVNFRAAGMYMLTLEDWDAPIGQVKIASSEKIMGDKPGDYIICEDGNMYFDRSQDLAMLPLNVTDEDWAIAEKMDAEIKALYDTEITLASESAIRTARSNYESMSWRYRALVQNLELLQEAESDILECLIDAAILNNEIDADDYPTMLELNEQYKGLNKRQQRYVKNYAALKEAYELSSDLNDQRIAAAIQEKVNALKNIMPIETLEKEPQVTAVRTEYAALAGRQQYLVDITILEEAEAQVAVLRAELVKQVDALIQAIPTEITLEAEPAITTAREGVDKLTILERKQVSYSKLEAAESKLRNLKNAMTKAAEVDAMIKSIGIVFFGDETRIAEARAAYNKLNETARAFCKKDGKLRRAEFIIGALHSWGIPVIVVVDAAAVAAVLLLRKKAKRKKKEENIVDNQ